MTERQFFDHIADRTPPECELEPRQITVAVLTVLSERLNRRVALALADELPDGLAHALRTDAPHAGFDAEGFYQRVGQRLGVREGIALELAAIVGLTLGELVRDDVLARVRRELPDELASLFNAPPPAPEAPSVHMHPERRTLAEGRGGGSRPLFAADPGAAQTESVARAENPHAETKLSSARGLTQEREGETLAEGRPGSERPLSEARDRDARD